MDGWMDGEEERRRGGGRGGRRGGGRGGGRRDIGICDSWQPTLLEARILECPHPGGHLLGVLKRGPRLRPSQTLSGSKGSLSCAPPMRGISVLRQRGRSRSRPICTWQLGQISQVKSRSGKLGKCSASRGFHRWKAAMWACGLQTQAPAPPTPAWRSRPRTYCSGATSATS